MLPRPDAGPFTADPVADITDDNVRLWRVRFRGSPVGWTRRPGHEIDELNNKHREARAKRRRDAGPYYPGGEE